MTARLTGLQTATEVLWYFTDNCYKSTCFLRAPSQESVLLTVLASMEENEFWIRNLYIKKTVKRGSKIKKSGEFLCYVSINVALCFASDTVTCI